MSWKNKNTGIRLPPSLRAKLGLSEDQESAGPSRKQAKWEQGGRPPTRKETRYKSRHGPPPETSALQNWRKRPATQYHDDRTSKKPRIAPPTTKDVKIKISKADVAKPSKKPPKKALTALQKLAAKVEGGEDLNGSPPPRSKAKLHLSQVEKEEEDEIAWLEAQLGMRKDKKKAKPAAEDDGLDDLLVDLDRIVSETRQHVAHGNSNSETGDNVSASEDDGDESGSDFDLEDDDSEANEISSDPEDDDEPGFSEMDSEVPHNENDDDGSVSSQSSHLVKAIIPKAGQGHYIPPAARRSNGGESKSESQVKLARQLKGSLNKLSEQNIGGILDDIERLYREHIRNDVTVSLTDLIIASISNHSSLIDTFVILHAALVSCLYKIVGVEFGAHFVETLVAEYERHYYDAIVSKDAGQSSTPEEEGPESLKGKEASNLLLLLAELYTFQVISCTLIYDIIRAFLSSRLEELEVELFLKLLKNIGPQLRQDDPSALKEIVQLVQQKASESSQTKQTSRTRFMLETLGNLKNNKLMEKRKVGQQNANVAADAIDRMKRFAGSTMKQKTVKAHEPLNVTLEDLRSADKKGKWWLVGAAWLGDPLVEAIAGQAPKSLTKSSADDDLLGVDQSATLLNLAKRQGMNTEIRRSIFVALMSSEDYVDACEKLGQLKLGDSQRPEIVRVLLHCLANEKAYNPYYTLVAQEMASSNRNIPFSLQYCLWDLFKEFGENLSQDDAIPDVEREVPQSKVRNMARAYAWWVAKGAITLDMLKPLNLLNLQPQTQEFLKLFFVQMFVSSQSASPLLEFSTTSDSEVESLSRDKQIVEVIVMKAIRRPHVTQGILHFLENADLKSLPEHHGVQKLVGWAVTLAKNTLNAGQDVSSLL